MVVLRPEGDERRLFDIVADPRETIDRARDEPKILAELQSHMDHINASSSASGRERILTDEERERLRSLGYL